jgi:hypothetical protein
MLRQLFAVRHEGARLIDTKLALPSPQLQHLGQREHVVVCPAVRSRTLCPQQDAREAVDDG